MKQAVRITLSLVLLAGIGAGFIACSPTTLQRAVTVVSNTLAGAQSSINAYINTPGVTAPSALVAANAKLAKAITDLQPLISSIKSGASGWALVDPLFAAAQEVIDSGLATPNVSTQTKLVAELNGVEKAINIIAGLFGHSTTNKIAPVLAQMSSDAQREVKRVEAQLRSEGLADFARGF
jgi:hypothetical protein